jgi:hypothetical protein
MASDEKIVRANTPGLALTDIDGCEKVSADIR